MSKLGAIVKIIRSRNYFVATDEGCDASVTKSLIRDFKAYVRKNLAAMGQELKR